MYTFVRVVVSVSPADVDKMAATSAPFVKVHARTTCGFRELVCA